MKIELTNEELEFLVASVDMKLEMIKNIPEYKNKASMLRTLKDKLRAVNSMPAKVFELKEKED